MISLSRVCPFLVFRDEEITNPISLEKEALPSRDHKLIVISRCQNNYCHNCESVSGEICLLLLKHTDINELIVTRKQALLSRGSTIINSYFLQ